MTKHKLNTSMCRFRLPMVLRYHLRAFIENNKQLPQMGTYHHRLNNRHTHTYTSHVTYYILNPLSERFSGCCCFCTSSCASFKWSTSVAVFVASQIPRIILMMCLLALPHTITELKHILICTHMSAGFEANCI